MISGHGQLESRTAKKLILGTRKMMTMMKTTAPTLNPCPRDLHPPRMVEISRQPLPNKHLFSLMPSSPTSIRKLAVKITRLFKSKLTYLLKRLQVRTIKWAMAKKRKLRSLSRTTPLMTMTTTHNQVSKFLQFLFCSPSPKSICPYRLILS